MIQKKSANASIVFVGMKPPDEKKTAESYSQYYGQLINSTEGLPTTVMVLASEKIDFNRIFKL